MEARGGVAKMQRAGVADSLLAPRSVAVDRGRLDPMRGVLRARYRIEDAEIDSGEPESAARAFLMRNERAFGFRRGMDDLRLSDVTRTSRSQHLTFQQMRDGLPVLGGNVKVNLDASGRPTMVLSNYRPEVATAELPSRALSAEDALQTAAARGGGRITVISDPRLVVYPAEVPRVAWHIIARPADDSAEWSILIDAADGEVLSWIDQSAHAHAEPGGAHIDGEPERERGESLRIEAATNVNGGGSVFDPDPLTTAGVTYGPPYVDANDADVPELNAQRKSVVLRDITRGVDGRYRLEGPYVRIVSGEEIGAAYTPPVASSADGFHFGRANDFFEAVNAYYHIDKSQRYAQEIAPDLDIHRFPIRVNPHGMGNADNSQYRPASNVLLFGTGGIDDAEDAHVIWHEYAHALLQASAPGLLSTVEGQALHEGWADYWAVSYTRELIETGAVPPRDWRQVFTWDGNETWNGRRLDHTGTYPQDAPCSQSSVCDIWQDGRLWATTLMEIYPHVGRRVLDHLNLLSHAYLTAPATMRDAAEAILQADVDHYDGTHLSILLEVFRRRGFVDSNAFAPRITHTPPPTTEDTHGTLRFEADVSSDATSVVAVRLVLLDDDRGPSRFNLVQEGATHYALDVPLDGREGELRYYIEVEDDAGHTVLHPGAAPAELLRVVVGPDEVPPTIAHDAPERVNEVDWPASIAAAISDRMGIDRAWVEYELNGAEAPLQGTFDLDEDDGAFGGSFPAIDVQPGDVVRYRIFAQDASRSGNVAVAPQDGHYTIEITSGSILRYYSFDGETNEGITATGAWQRGQPTFGTSTARSGTSVWATVLEGSYPEQRTLSTLALPPITVHADSAYLVFWHWYDIEHDGRALPENDEPAILWDGGNVKASVDGGLTWNVLTPEGGYAGRISAAHENVLGGEMGFGGFSRGWRREIMPLPAGEQIRIRFDFGTDAGNIEPSRQYAGWYIDDVEIRTGLPVDTDPPAFTSLPPQRMTAGATHPPVRIRVRAEDDTGIESIRLYAQLYDAARNLITTDTVMFDMNAGDNSLFEVDFKPRAMLEPGHVAEYQLSARDFDGSETWESAGGAGFRIDYLHHEQHSVLDDLRPTGLWTWSSNRWVTAWRHDTVPRSSLLIGPIDLPVGATGLELHLEHQYSLGDGIGGNLKISADDGRTWSVLEPTAGYDAVFAPGSEHEMADEAIFSGAAHEVRNSVFDLSAFGGQQVRLRLDYAAGRAATQDDWWAVVDASVSVVALQDNLPVPRELRLHANYPDPFSTTTTIGYTLPEEGIILLEVYDALGRRVDVIRYALQYPGTYTLTYDGSRLAAGVYYLSLIVGDHREVQRLVVAR